MSAKAPIRNLLADPRYAAFVERYHADPERFAVEVTGFIPSSDQSALFAAIAEPDAKVSVVSGTGCFAAGTVMMRADGSGVRVEDIHVGDRLMGPDGNSARRVLELKRGREPMYRFTYQDGGTHVFNESHILCLVNTYAKNGRLRGEKCTVTVRDYLKWNKTRRRSHAIYRSGVERFDRPAEPLPVPPYVLGIWLGDGATSKPEVCTPDREVGEAWQEWCESIGCVVRWVQEPGCWGVRASRVVGTEQANPASKRLREAGVFDAKRIPDAYRFASVDDRLQLLAGLIDTDGFFDQNGGGFEWIQKCETMARDVAWLARSVGMHATVSRSIKSCQTGAVGTYWRLWISRGIERIPVRVPRRMPAGRECDKKELWHGIRSVDPLGEGDYFGFVLDGDNRFLGHDFTVLHNTGKTATFGRIVLWSLLCHPGASIDGKWEVGSNTYIGAPVVQQVAEGVWKEMADAMMALKSGPHAWIAQYVVPTATKYYVRGFKEQWFVGQIALKKGESVSIAGKHRYWQLIIIDEAAGVGDDHANVIEGTQTSPGNRTLLASQGARNAGWFYDTHHTKEISNGGSWVSLCFNSERSPFVTNKWLREREIECGGRHTVEYRIRVLGQFATDSSNYLLSREEVETIFNEEPLIGEDEAFGLVVLGDVAMGEYRDDSVALVAKVVGDGDFGPEARRGEVYAIPICANDKNEIDFAGDLVNIVGKLDNATLYVDNGGVGATVNKLIERSGVPVQRIDWGKPCFKREYQNRFYNQRACAQVRTRDAVKQGRLRITASVDPRLKQKIVDQGSRLPYHFSEAGGLRFVMDKKEEMRKKGIKSPDLWDATSFIFLEGLTYTPRAATGEGGAMSGAEAALDRLRKARAAAESAN